MKFKSFSQIQATPIDYLNSPERPRPKVFSRLFSALFPFLLPEIIGCKHSRLFPDPHLYAKVIEPLHLEMWNDLAEVIRAANSFKSLKNPLFNLFIDFVYVLCVLVRRGEVCPLSFLPETLFAGEPWGRSSPMGHFS